MQAFPSKIEDEQVKELIERKGAFSADAQWCTSGMKLMGSQTNVRAQLLQIEKEKKGSDQEASSKAEKRLVKITKVEVEKALKVFSIPNGRP